MVTSSAYSRSLPTGMPMPMRVTLMPSGLSSFREIDGGGFAFHVRVGGDDHFFDCAVGDAFDEALDAQLLRTDAAQGGEGPVQYVIEPVELARGFDADDVRRLFDLRRWCCWSRSGSRQYWHCAPSLMLLQISQRPSLSLTSRMACERKAASSRLARRTWKAMRWADFWPMPGRRLNSVIRRARGSAKSGIR